jgi:hypothetical protein
MEAVWTDGVAAISRAVRGEPRDINGYPYTAGHIPKSDHPPYIGSERSAANIGYCRS